MNKGNVRAPQSLPPELERRYIEEEQEYLALRERHLAQEKERLRLREDAFNQRLSQIEADKRMQSKQSPNGSPSAMQSDTSTGSDGNPALEYMIGRAGVPCPSPMGMIGYATSSSSPCDTSSDSSSSSSPSDSGSTSSSD